MMKRYFSSFIITALIYSSILASSLYFINESSLSKSSKTKSEDIQRVSINLVEPKKIEPPKPIEKPKKIEKRVEKKIVKKEKPKPKKKIVKKIEPKKIEKKVEEKIVKKEPVKQNLAPKKLSSKSIQKDKDIEAKKLKALQNRYFATISETINKNKSYPRRAVLRHLQDDVKIEFMISPKGELLSFNILDGKKIFHKSAQKAIEDSFPILPPNGVISANTSIKLILSYRLN